jgi:hypothetical protein
MSDTNTGKLWKNESYHLSFNEADLKRNRLIEIWSADEKHKGMQVKVRALSQGRFVVKTRLHPDFEEKKEKKRGKNRKRNKKTSNRRMFDPTATV